jgi:hypothetical protein
MGNIRNPEREEPRLFSGILHIKTTPEIHTFHIHVGTENGIKKTADKRVDSIKKIEKDIHCHLLPLDELSAFPPRMASGLEEHFNNVAPSSPTPADADVGNMKIFIHREGNTTIAAAIEYYPKDEVSKSIHGINPAFFEIKILEHLRDTEGVTHVTTQDGIVLHTKNKNNDSTSNELRNMLAARGLRWERIYPIDEWIEKLRSTPNYSRIRN